MSIVSAQYNDDEKLAMARAAVAVVGRWGVSDEMVERLLEGEGGQRRCSAFIAHCDAYSLKAIEPRGGWVLLTRPLMEPAHSISYWQMASRV